MKRIIALVTAFPFLVSVSYAATNVAYVCESKSGPLVLEVVGSDRVAFVSLSEPLVTAKGTLPVLDPLHGSLLSATYGDSWIVKLPLDKYLDIPAADEGVIGSLPLAKNSAEFDTTLSITAWKDSVGAIWGHQEHVTCFKK